MKTATLNFGTLGRCACGALGRRRAAFANEPLCHVCAPERSSYLRVLDPRTSDARMVGRLTLAQRVARVRQLGAT